jgi:diacylglycerol kinase (ATP)
MTNLQPVLPDKWLIVVNPNAGVKKGSKDWPQISRLLNSANIEHLCVLTEHRNHANKLVEEFIAEGYRKIAVIGGDGTMNEVVNGIFWQSLVPPSEITLGMIPVGTGNDWCRTFGIPFDYRSAVEVLKNEKIFLQDIGRISYYKDQKQIQRYFINIAGMGYDALVAKKTNLSKEKGRGGPLTYLYFVFSGLFQYKFVEAVIDIDNDQVFKGEIFSMNVGICKYNGGGMMQVPDAVPDDGLFDITLIKKAPKWMVIRYANKLYDGTLVNLPFVSTFRGTSIRIRSVGKIYLETDGESLGHSPFVFEMLKQSLKVVTGIRG